LALWSAVHDDRSIACWRTAEYASAGQCGIGIATIRGVADTPSVAIAEKAGFREIETYSILVVTREIEWPGRLGGS
jgi:hypothetical protein